MSRKSRGLLELEILEMKREGNSFMTDAAHRSDLKELIRLRAQEIYIRKGRVPGHDVENWAQAEREVLQEKQSQAARRAIVIRVDRIQYVGEYSPETSGDYVPGELVAGVPIAVRFEGDKMYVTRPNGQELETTVVQRTG